MEENNPKPGRTTVRVCFSFTHLRAGWAVTEVAGLSWKLPIGSGQLRGLLCPLGQWQRFSRQRAGAWSLCRRARPSQLPPCPATSSWLKQSDRHASSRREALSAPGGGSSLGPLLSNDLIQWGDCPALESHRLLMRNFLLKCRHCRRRRTKTLLTNKPRCLSGWLECSVHRQLR